MGADALVIGAGPAGLITSTLLASNGFIVKAYEEHDQVGKPSHCAGIISIDGLDKLGVEPSDRFIQNRISGGRLYAPDGSMIEIRDKRPRAYAVDRAVLDEIFAEKAIGEGVEILSSKSVKKINFTNGFASGISGRGWDDEGKLIVDAEGASRRLLHDTRIATRERAPLIGVNTEVHSEVEPDLVEVWFDSRIAPGFFAWVIPISEDMVRVGLACNSGDAVKSLRSFIKRRFGIYEFTLPRGGLVLVDGPLKQTAFNGLMLVGDAAGHAKPTTGGGVVLGGLCAREAGMIASSALKSGDTSSKFLLKYDRTCRSKYGSQFRTMRRARKLFEHITDNGFNRIFSAYRAENIDEVVAKYIEEGDIDLQEGFLKRVLLDPKLTGLILKTLGRVALSWIN